ncbi:hypothetical protein K1T71_004993 [Dendrolimus kikuchii]|uniref:Uncharacterized protein n=1 Tax=Dendrolimus kikuchii TaxID=765133 RepID=A0ACC1D5R0_9NEOP|nr:hypothetical protein K1T71_004993 [Dendrolimus kikuchii]
MSKSNCKQNVKCHKCKNFGHYKNQCSLFKKKQSNAFSAIFISGNFSNTDWYIDSGASMHMTSNKQWLYNISKPREVDKIFIADKSTIPVECCGILKITTLVNDTEYEIPVMDVLYVPNLATNLISVSQLICKGNKYLQDSGIIHQKTNPYTPEQNGLCERLNRTVVEKAKCMLFDADLKKHFWAEAVNTAVYLRNRSIASGINKTPFEIWYGKKPDISNLRIFGSTVMVHIPKEKRLKWDRKAKICILMGYSNGIKGYRVYDPKIRKINTTRDIVIIEEGKYKNEIQIEINENKKNENITTEDYTGTVGEEIYQKETKIVQEMEEKNNLDEIKDYMHPTEDIKRCTSPDIKVQEMSKQKPKRQRKKPDYYGHVNMCAAYTSENGLTYEEAINGPEKEQWLQAIADELKSFEENQVWDIVDTPKNGSVVQCKWVLRKKYDTFRKKLEWTIKTLFLR